MLRPRASAHIRSHIRIVFGASKKLHVNKRGEQRLRRDRVEPPQPFDLRLRQA